MNHEIAARGVGIIDKFNNTRILICGAGSLGGNLADQLSRLQFDRLCVVDFDKVSDTNIATQPYARGDIGKLKVTALANLVYKNTGTQIRPVSTKLTSSNINKVVKEFKPDVIIDCFDNSESRQLLFDYANESKIACLHGGMVDGFGEVKWNSSYIVPSGTKGLDVCDYPLSKTIIMLTVACLQESLIMKVDKGSELGYNIFVNNGKITINTV